MRQDSKPPGGASLPFQQRMRIAWTQFTGSLLLILSDEDYTAKEFLEYVSSDPAWSAALMQPNLIRHDVKGADHTFSNLNHSRFVETFTKNWLKSL